MPIQSRAATRIDLAGGTIDLWPLYLMLDGGLTINAAIDLCASAKVEPLPGTRIEIVSADQGTSVSAEDLESLSRIELLPLISRLIHHFAPAEGFRIETQARVPAGSGLGGSSTLAIAVCGALNEFTQRRLTHEQMIGIARDIEAQVLRIPTGEQDYYAAAFGGFNAWRFDVDCVSREPYSVPLQDLQNRLLLFYSGMPRSSGINNWQVYKQTIDGDPLTVEALAQIRNEALSLDHALRHGDWDGAYDAVSREWEARKRLAPAITTPEIEQILEFGRAHGCRAGKVCGAGGGGCLFLMMDPSHKPEVRRQALQRGFRLLDFELAPVGLVVERS